MPRAPKAEPPGDGIVALKLLLLGPSATTKRPAFRVALGGHTVEGCLRLRGETFYPNLAVG